MKYYTKPQTRIRKLGPTHSIRVESMGKVLAVLSGYPSIEAATEDAKRIATELNEGVKTLEEVNRLLIFSAVWIEAPKNPVNLALQPPKNRQICTNIGQFNALRPAFHLRVGK